jgi:polyisoprenoid-binding protein YceI
VSGTQLREFRGRTTDVTGEVLFDPADLQRARASITVNDTSLRSDNPTRDRHMYETVLETGRFPAVTLDTRQFQSMGGTNGAAREGTIVGTLRLHGVERPVTIPVRLDADGSTLRGRATFSIILGDFNVTPPRLLPSQRR